MISTHFIGEPPLSPKIKLCLDAKNSERENYLILFHIFVTGHWVAGRERFRAGGKIFSPFWELAICGRVWWAEQTGGGDGRQLCPMDRIKPTLWKMSPFGPRPTSHAQSNQPTHGTNCKNISGKISVYGIYRIKSTLWEIWTGIKSYAVTNPAHTSCRFAKKIFLNQKFLM